MLLPFQQLPVPATSGAGSGGLAFDAAGDLHANVNVASGLLVFAAGPGGNVAPIPQVVGAATNIQSLCAVAIH